MSLRTRTDRATSWRERWKNDLGATLVEYALVLSLVAAASIGAIQFMQDEGEDRLESRETSAGAPDVNAAAPGSGSGGGGPGGGAGGSTDSGTPGAVQAHAGLSWTTDRPTPPGNKWSATVTITITDPANGNAPVAGAVVTGVWDPSDSGQTTCTTNLSGQCGVTQGGMAYKPGQNGHIATAKFTVSGVAGTNVTYTETPPSTPDIPAPA